MSFLKNVDSISFMKILSIAIVLAIMISVPIGVILFQQETRINSRAAYEKPKIATTPKNTPGPVPEQPPVIGRVYPWVGKTGDIIWLQGNNFGSNPELKSLVIGGVRVEDGAVEAWEDELIQTTIPANAKQGGVVELTIGDHPKNQSLPYVLYDQNTKTKLRKQGNIVSLESGDMVTKAIIWTGDDKITTQKHETIIIPDLGKATVFDTDGLPILSIILLDNQGKIVPYYVNPVEFDF